MDVLGSEISRRSVVRTAAWGVPVVSLAAASPAFAVSGAGDFWIDLRLREWVVPVAEPEEDGPTEVLLPFDLDHLPRFFLYVNYEGNVPVRGGVLTWTISAPSASARATDESSTEGTYPQWGPLVAEVFAIDDSTETPADDDQPGAPMPGAVFTSTPFNGTSQTYTMALPDFGPDGVGLGRLLIRLAFAPSPDLRVPEDPEQVPAVEYVVTASLEMPDNREELSPDNNSDSYFVEVLMQGGGAA